MTTSKDSDQTPILANLMDWMQAETELLLSFEDLSGITYDYKQLYLPERLRRHVRPFCDYAKHHMKGTHQCPLSKSLANAKAIQQPGEALVGCCYLGLTDIFRTLRHANRVMGVFYFGSVVREGDHQRIRESVSEHCKHQPTSVKTALLRRLEKVPRLNDSQIKQAQKRLENMINTVELILEGMAIPADLYETHKSNRVAAEHVRIMHPLIHRALRMIREQHYKPINLTSIAKTLRCHPGYLSRLFRKQVGQPVSAYLRQTRIERACRLLRMRKLDVSSVGLEVGYEDKSNFGRAFRKVMVMSPSEYLAQFDKFGKQVL